MAICRGNTNQAIVTKRNIRCVGVDWPGVAAESPSDSHNSSNAPVLPPFAPGRRKILAMGYLTIASRLIAPASVLVLLSGCGDSFAHPHVRAGPRYARRVHGRDARAVVDAARFHAAPAATRRAASAGAVRTVAGRVRPGAGRRPGRRAHGRQPRTGGVAAGCGWRRAGGYPPARRSGSQAQRRATTDFIDKLLYWRKPTRRRPSWTPAQEAQRLRQNSALGQSPVTGDTPIIREKKKGWFQDLFSWL